MFTLELPFWTVKSVATSDDAFMVSENVNRIVRVSKLRENLFSSGKTSSGWNDALLWFSTG